MCDTSVLNILRHTRQSFSSHRLLLPSQHYLCLLESDIGRLHLRNDVKSGGHGGQRLIQLCGNAVLMPRSSCPAGMLFPTVPSFSEWEQSSATYVGPFMVDSTEIRGPKILVFDSAQKTFVLGLSRILSVTGCRFSVPRILTVQ
jgi:hypothetical protein